MISAPLAIIRSGCARSQRHRAHRGERRGQKSCSGHFIVFSIYLECCCQTIAARTNLAATTPDDYAFDVCTVPLGLEPTANKAEADEADAEDSE